MDKFALFEVGTTAVRLTLAKGIAGEYFNIYKVLEENVHINQHIEADGLIKSAKVHECITILKMYKKIADAAGVTNRWAVAANSLVAAKNYKSFIDELGVAIAMEFRLLTPEQETNAIYTAVINTLDVAKGVIVNISAFSTRIIHYSRRMILDSATFEIGAENFKDAAVFKKELETKAAFLKGLDPETQIVGVSDTFTSFARIARKMHKYPLEIDHDYAFDAETFHHVFKFIKELDVDKRQKLKGISNYSAQTLVGGMEIVEVILKHSGLKNLVTATAYRNVGILFNAVVPATCEKPLADLLGYSFDVILTTTGHDRVRAQRHYDLALLLFRQIRVLHKLPRSYIKVLRVAANLYRLGTFGSNYTAILAAPILGASHKEIVLAAFSASFKKWEDFNLTEWLKYKDLTTDEDLEAVRKLAMMLAMAEAFDIRGQEIIKDLSCDVLGDSVILKLITETDARAQKIDVSAADVEIFHAKKYAHEFNRTFKKSLELL